MSVAQPFLQEVIDAHIDIEQWLSGRAESARLALLLQRFSPHFGMVTTQGASLDRSGLERLFAQGHGQRPGLAIQIGELEEICASPEGAVVRYREIQTYREGPRSERRSTAVFERNAQGRILWRHLHETAIAS